MRAKALPLLALHFIKHTLRKLTFTYRRGGSKRFLENYASEGLPPVDPATRTHISEWQSCIGCGLCDRLCPQSHAVPSVGGISLTELLAAATRDLSQLEAARADAQRVACDGCGACEDACPVGVPIRDVVTFLATPVA
ncbi:MAG: ferredoxin [Bradymonadia bacterium]|jgi:ferredoxin